MGYKTVEKEERIEMFNGHKIINRMIKPRSPITVLFCTNDLPDEWLIDLVEYKTKSGLIKHRCMVTAADLERKYKIYEKDGFITNN